MISAVKQLLVRAAWASVAVLLLHAVIAKTPFRPPLDFTMHFLGGMAIAFFSFHALACFMVFPGLPACLARYLFSFSLACTVGLFWEFAESFSDVVRHTHIQKDLPETMCDLIADTAGALTALLLIWLVDRLLRKNRNVSSN